MRRVEGFGADGAPARQKGRHPVPHAFQKVGQQRRLARVGQQHVGALTHLGGDDAAGWVKDKGLDQGVDGHRFQRLAKVKAQNAGAQLRLIDLRDQFGLAFHRQLPLQRQAVAERVHEQNPHDQHHQRHHVEHDDLARKGRAVQRHQAASAAPVLQPLDRGVGRYPVFAQKDVARPFGSAVVLPDAGCRCHGARVILRCSGSRCRTAFRSR